MLRHLPSAIRRFSAGAAGAGIEIQPYDVCIIGAGPGGFAAAVRGYDLGKRVCLIERNGGSGLWGAGCHNGALATKAMWQLSRRHRHVREEFTVRTLPYQERLSDIQRLVQEAIDIKVNFLQVQLNALHDPHIYRRTGLARETVSGSVDFLAGNAAFVDPQTVVVSSNDGSATTVSARQFVIAAGSRPRVPNGWHLDGNLVLTSDNIGSLSEFPKSLMVMGAGVIGCEYSTIFSNFGSTKVVLVNEGKQRLLPGDDEDLGLLIERNFTNAGVEVRNNVKVLNVNPVPGQGVDITLGNRLPSGKEGWAARPPFRVERVLLCVGRVPNVENMGLEKAGVTLGPRNGVVVDDHLRCEGAQHIYAVGDVTADVGLVNVAEMEGRYAIEHMFAAEGQRVTPLIYDNISSVMFLRPEVASVGLCEQEARAKGVPYICAKLGFDMVNRAIINARKSRRPLHERTSRAGFIKILVSPDEKKTLLGMRCVGEDASSILGMATMLIHRQGSVRELEKAIQPHPTIAEAVQECARLIMGHSLFKSFISPNCSVWEFNPETPQLAVVKPAVPQYLQ